MSLAARKASTCSDVSAISPLRMRSSSVSRMWVTSVMLVTPNVEAPPLTEWAVRKIAFRSSASGASMFTASSSRSISASSSSASSKKTWKNWLISMVMVILRVVRSASFACALSADDLLHYLDEPLWIEGFDQPAIGAGGAALGFHLVGRFGGQHQDGRLLVGRQFAQQLDQLQAVHARHVLVGQHQVDALQLGFFQAVLAVDRLDDEVAGGLQAERHHLAQGTGIINCKDCLGHLGSHLI